MIDEASITGLVASHGIAILAPMAMIEGPIVTVIAGYLASLGLLPLWQVGVCVILADIAGDCLLYGIGRGLLDWLPARLLARLGITAERRAQMAAAFRDKGVRVLVIGKLTHAAGFAVLLGAGAARMPILIFLLANLAATIPKSLAFLTLGYLFGSAHAAIGHWLSIGSAAVLLVLIAVAAAYLRRRKATP